MALQRHLSKKRQRDPAGAIRWEKKYRAGIDPLIASFHTRVLEDFVRAWETGKIRSLEAGKIDPGKFYAHIDKLAEEEIGIPARKVVQRVIPKAYDQGQVFASIVLGAPLEERGRVWTKLATLIAQNESEFKGYSAESARRINRIIGDGLITEETQGQIIKDLQAEFEISKGRATRIIRTETVRAVNTGALDRYRRDGIEPSGHGRTPPLHPGCRCTLIVKRIDGKMVIVWLAAADDRVCPECQDLDGSVV